MVATTKNGFRQYTVLDTAITQGRRIGIFGDTAARIMRMARRAAVCSHPSGNRRYQDFIFQIHDGAVEEVHRINLAKEG